MSSDAMILIFNAICAVVVGACWLGVRANVRRDADPTKES